MKQRTVGVFIVMLLLVAMAPVSTVSSSAQPQGQAPQSELAQKFYNLAMQARTKTYELRDLISGQISSIPGDIEDLLEEADSLVAEGTIQSAIQAMTRYRNAYKQLHQFLSQQGVDPDAPEEGRGLLVAINRTFTRIERYNATLIAITETLTESQYGEFETYVDCVQGNLTEAKVSLSLANESLWLDPPNIVWATQNLTEANRNIQEAIQCMRLIAKAFNRWRLEYFLTRVNTFRERIQERVRERQGILGEVLENLGYANMEDFHHTLNRLIESARGKVDDMKNAIHDLTPLVDKLKELAKNIPEQHGPP